MQRRPSEREEGKGRVVGLAWPLARHFPPLGYSRSISNMGGGGGGGGGGQSDPMWASLSVGPKSGSR